MAEGARIRITRITDGDDVARQVEPKMHNLGNAVGRRMQRLVPKRTWALHDTIANLGVERRGPRVTVRVGFGSSRVRYGLHVERGTSRMAAQPYARPALLQSRAGDLLNGRAMDKTKGQRNAEATQRRADRAADRRTQRQENEAES